MKSPAFWCKISLLALVMFWFFMYFAGLSRVTGAAVSCVHGKIKIISNLLLPQQTEARPKLTY